MTDWERVKRELQEAGYCGFEFESGDTPVPGLSGEWVAGDIVREERLTRENQPFLIRILDALPRIAGVATDPEYVPESIREIAHQYGLKVMIVSVSENEVHIALCDSPELADC